MILSDRSQLALFSLFCPFPPSLICSPARTLLISRPMSVRALTNLLCLFSLSPSSSRVERGPSRKRGGGGREERRRQTSKLLLIKSANARSSVGKSFWGAKRPTPSTTGLSKIGSCSAAIVGDVSRDCRGFGIERTRDDGKSNTSAASSATPCETPTTRDARW